MGQSVSVDERQQELKELLRSTGTENAEPGSPQNPPRRAAAKHHIKAWQFEEDGRAVVDSPVALCDRHGVLDVEIRRSCSYLLLHVWAGSTAGEEPSAGAATALLEDLAARAGAAFTPRGLAFAHPRNTGGSDAATGPSLRHAIFVWHGLDVSPSVKARAFARAFELDAAIGDGLLRHRTFLESLADALVLRGASGGNPPCAASQSAVRCSLPNEGKSAEAGACGRNQLLHAILQGMPPATGCGGGRRGAGRPGGAGCRRFPLVAQTVANNVGRPVGLSTAPPPAAPPVTATAGAPPLVPRLALGLAAAEAASPSATERRLAEEDWPAYDDGIRKRLRGGNMGAFPYRNTGVGGLVAPKSARVGDSYSSKTPQQEPAPHQRGVVPSLNLASAQAAAVGQRTTIADRLDAPAMLNLEEINMSEEDLIRSYDPNNEENNYHLPDHLYKALQLKQYRQACSEVVANAVYLGGYQVAGDLECLQRHGITHIVNMAADVCDNSFPDQFSYLTYYLKDTNSEDISPLFYRTLDWIQNAVDSGGRVLVHCREGVSRSATMAIAYLMWRQGLSFEAAHERLRKARPICNPNTGFTCQLLTLGKRLGVSGRGGQACTAAPGVADRPQLLRVMPHHPKEPFLLLAPLEWPRSWPHFDPRFGWVVLRGNQLFLWLGSQVPDPDAVQVAVRQHARWVEAFERRSLSVNIVSQGAESPQFFQAVTTTPGSAGPEVFGLADANPAYNADFEVIRTCTGGRGGMAASEEALTHSSPSAHSSRSLSSTSLHGIGGG